ncbi:MAG TPA: hypothetical protein VN680_13250 [Burkholderiaceae bacterium]|jgi:hypothetical protein|nr:hypothetical protein [Burkholderiaceae bacterium]
MKFALVASLAAAAAMLSCATGSYSYSQLYGYRYFRTPTQTFPLIILNVDGKATIDRPVLVEPGPRLLRVQSTQGPGPAFSKEVQMDIEPCTRYWLVAVKDTRLTKDFNVVVDYKEQIGGCTPPTEASRQASAGKSAHQ